MKLQVLSLIALLTLVLATGCTTTDNPVASGLARVTSDLGVKWRNVGETTVNVEIKEVSGDLLIDLSGDKTQESEGGGSLTAGGQDAGNESLLQKAAGLFKKDEPAAEEPAK